jgi:hypothetical protein
MSCTTLVGDRMQFDQLRRREFITLLGGAAAWLASSSLARQRCDCEPHRNAGDMCRTILNFVKRLV